MGREAGVDGLLEELLDLLGDRALEVEVDAGERIGTVGVADDEAALTGRAPQKLPGWLN